MLCKFCVFIIYFSAGILSTEAMTVIKHHGNRPRGENVLRNNVQRKIHFDPAPPVDTRRRRRTLENNKIVSVEHPLSSQVQINMATKEALDNFLHKNAVKIAAAVTTMPTERLEVVTKQLDPSKVTAIEPTPASEEGSLAGKRNNPGYKLERPNNRATVVSKEPLSYNIVENLVLSIQKNSQMDIEYIVKDLKQKLDMVLDKNVPTLRGNDASSKPKKVKKQNLLNEMDKILDSFLRTTANSSSESSSGEAELPPPGPIMRSDPKKDYNEEDLEFDLEGDDGAQSDKLRFNLKE